MTTKVYHEEFGVGELMIGMHAQPDESGNIAWHDVMFEHGIESQVPAEDLQELSTNTLGSYATKALRKGDMAARMSNGGKVEGMTKIADKRLAGVQLAARKMGEKTGSKRTADNVAKNAKDTIDSSKKWRDDEEANDKANKSYKKTDAGIKKMWDKGDKVKKEEVELVGEEAEDLSKMSYDQLKKHHDSVLHDYRMSQYDDSIGGHRLIDHHADRLAKARRAIDKHPDNPKNKDVKKESVQESSKAMSPEAHYNRLYKEAHRLIDSIHGHLVDHENMTHGKVKPHHVRSLHDITSKLFDLNEHCHACHSENSENKARALGEQARPAVAKEPRALTTFTEDRRYRGVETAVREVLAQNNPVRAKAAEKTWRENNSWMYEKK